MPVSRVEEWIAPHAMPILAVLSALILAGGALAYFVRQGDLNRVERLERTIRCQDSPECRQFIYQAIRELLRQRMREGRAIKHRDPKGNAVVTQTPGIDQLLPKLLPPTQRPSKPIDRPDEVDPGEGRPSPPARSHRPPEPITAPPTGQPTPGNVPSPVNESPPPREPPAKSLLPGLPSLPEVAGDTVKELPCTALKEIHGLC